jgi:hypothetical protein
MEVQALKLIVTEAALCRMAVDAVPPSTGVRDVRVRLTAEGAYIHGTYQMLVGMPFETLWELSVQAGKIVAKLANVKVAGLGAGLLKSTLLTQLAAQAARTEGLSFHDDTLLLDLDRMLASQGYPARTNLTLIRCSEGSLLIEAHAQG